MNSSIFSRFAKVIKNTFKSK